MLFIRVTPSRITPVSSLNSGISAAEVCAAIFCASYFVKDFMKQQKLKDRATKIGLSLRVWCEFASVPGMYIHESEASNFANGRYCPAEKAKTLLAALVTIEDLVESTVVKIALTDAANIRAAIARLAEVRRNPATAPYVGRAAATAPYDATHTTSASASAILATPLEK